MSNSKIGCGLIQLFFQHSIRGQDPHQSPALRVKINIRSACSIARQQVGLDKARKFSTSPIYACERHSYILKISLDNQFRHHCSGASLAGTTNPDNKIRRPGESFVIKHWANTVHMSSCKLPASFRSSHHPPYWADFSRFGTWAA